MADEPDQQPTDPAEAAVRVAFMKRWNADKARGSVRDLSEYQALFPGYETWVASEYEAAGADDDTDDPGTGSVHGRRYREVREIGRGGMGVVLDVWDRHLRRSLAMKILPTSTGTGTPHASGGSSRSLRRFFDEAWITGRLAHPGIVPVHDLGFDAAGRPFFTMTRIKGESLRTLIERSRDDAGSERSQARLLGIVLRVCEAITFAHAEGVIHRDLKPANVMVGSFGETYVLDWGLASTTSRLGPDGEATTASVDAPDRTRAGDVVGTPAYMAPEQAHGDHDAIGPSTDIYAIGAMLYHVVSGEPPYTGSSSQRVVDAVISGPPRPLESLARDRCPPELVAICAKAMARDPASRYASMSELADDLRAFLELRVVRAYETGPFAEARKWIRRNRALTAMGGAAILAMAIGLGVAMFQRSVAEDNARQSDADFEFAHTVVDDMVQRVAAKDLAVVPGTERVRATVLERALSFYRELLHRRSSNPRVRLFVSRALCELAQAERELGRFEEAHAHLVEAVAEARRVFESAPLATATATSVAISHTRLASLQHVRGLEDDANAQLEQALDVLELALRELGEDAALLRHKAETLSLRGAWISQTGDWTATIAVSRAILDAARGSMAIDRDHPDAHTITVTALINIASAHSALGQIEEGRPVIRQAMTHIESRPELWTSRRAREKLAGAFDLLQHFTADEDPEAAMRYGQRAVAIAKSLTEEFPSIARHHYYLGRMLRNAALPLNAESRARYCEQSVAAHRKAVELAPRNELFARKLMSVREDAHATFLEFGDHRRLAAQAANLEARRLDQPADLPALMLVQCALLVRRDSALTDDQRPRLASEYAARAVASLDRAVQAGELERLERDEFEVIEDRSDFRALQQRIADSR